MTRAVLIAGAGGMLGTALQRVLGEAGTPFTAPAERDFDITDPVAVTALVAGFAREHPGGLLVNAAAYTNVEAAEDDSATAYRVNELGARLLAQAARTADLGFVHVSTDFVFDGAKEGPYCEDDAPNPLSVYGASKLAGEHAVAAAMPDALIVRTAWVFGPGGDCFPVKILRAARTNPTLSVVTDEIGSPTYTVDLARAILVLAQAHATGLYHVAGSGACSRFELARETLRLAGVDSVVRPVAASAFRTKAARPANSVLDCAMASDAGVVMPDWRDSLRRFLQDGDPVARGTAAAS
ncbi:MAG: dTDP-4-dehydrorhamnose reductase [Coriobacteriia bacterium]|nr:dTDP-4-dehydrorhamnose reductase [Coriobacteriia bacterium]